MFPYFSSVHAVVGHIRSDRTSPGTEGPGTPPHAFLWASAMSASFARPPTGRTELPLKTLEPPLPDLFLLFGEYSGDSLIHLLQLLGYLSAGIRAEFFKLLQMFLEDGPDFLILLGIKAQFTPKPPNHHPGGCLRRLWGSCQPVWGQNCYRSGADDKAGQ